VTLEPKCLMQHMAFLGGSGSGKSILLRTILGLIPKRGGKINILGVDLDSADPGTGRATEKRWGVLFQQGALFSSLILLRTGAESWPRGWL